VVKKEDIGGVLRVKGNAGARSLLLENNGEIGGCFFDADVTD
jgi:hypothetical protein